MLKLLDRQIWNVIHLGIGFLTFLTAIFTITDMLKTINASISEEKPEYTVDGFIASSLLYFIYAIGLWFTPSAIAFLGARTTIAVGAFFLMLYISSVLLEISYVTYIGVFIGGVGSAFVWAAGGNYLIDNSDPKTVSRNVGIFWLLYSSSHIFGNLVAVFLFEGKVHIDHETRHSLLYVLAGLEILACIIFILLGKPVRYTTSEPPIKEGALEALTKTWSLFTTKDMLILLLSFCYAGFQHSFGNGIYQASIGFTQHFGDKAKQLVPLAGIIYGIGDSLGGLLNIFMPKIGLNFNRRTLMIVGFVSQVIAYCLTFISIPNDAVFGETSSSAIIEPKIWLAMLCNFLIGIGDASANTQILAILAVLEPNRGGQTCALYKFTKNIGTTAFYFISYYIGLQLQLGFLIITGIVGTVAFAWVDIRSIKKEKRIL